MDIQKTNAHARKESVAFLRPQIWDRVRKMIFYSIKHLVPLATSKHMQIHHQICWTLFGCAVTFLWKVIDKASPVTLTRWVAAYHRSSDSIATRDSPTRFAFEDRILGRSEVRYLPSSRKIASSYPACGLES